jgi:glycosyltransferase involved in cell wall biosynthesis
MFWRDFSRCCCKEKYFDLTASKKTMKVSIIIPNYNYARFILATIDSIMAQSYKDVEIIVVDDGSTDNSREVLVDLQQKFPKLIKTIFQSNQGQGSAMNAGFYAATGDIVAFLDADDIWKPDKLQRVVDIFKTTDVVGVMHHLDVVDIDGNVVGTTQGTELDDDLASLIVETGNAWHFPPTSGLTFRRNTLKKVFPLLWAEWPDGFMIYSAAFLGKIRTLAETLGSYRNHGANNHAGVDMTCAREAKMLAGTELTNQYINSFLERIDYPKRVDLSRNLQYRRIKYYRCGKWNAEEARAIAGLIITWKYYSSKEKVYFLGRFILKNLQLLVRSNSYIEASS